MTPNTDAPNDDAPDTGYYYAASPDSLILYFPFKLKIDTNSILKLKHLK